MAEINDNLRIASKADLKALTAADVKALPDTTKQIDIGARPNANLLHNWYFGNPVNRNGFAEGTFGDATAFVFDRVISARSVLKLTENGLEFTKNESFVHGFVGQILYNSEVSVGETVTVSFLTTDELFTATLVVPTVEENQVYKTFYRSTGDKQIYIENQSTRFNIRYQQWGTDTNTIIAMKVERGDQQTLAHQDANGNWVLNEIPDYAEQMAICSQYDKSSGAYLGKFDMTASDVGALDRKGYGWYNGNVDELKEAGGYLVPGNLEGTMPPDNSPNYWYTVEVFPGGTGAYVQMWTRNRSQGLPAQVHIRHWQGAYWDEYLSIGDFKSDGSVPMTQPLKLFTDKGSVGTEYSKDITITYMRSLFGDESHMIGVSNNGVRYITGTKDDKFGPTYNIFGEHNVKMLKVEVVLSTLSWVTSGAGLYYATAYAFETAPSKILAITIADFTNLRTTDVITPYNKNNTAVMLTSNVTSFKNTEQSKLSFWITYVE